MGKAWPANHLEGGGERAVGDDRTEVKARIELPCSGQSGFPHDDERSPTELVSRLRAWGFREGNALRIAVPAPRQSREFGEE